MRMVSDVELDDMATALAKRLNQFLDVVEGSESWGSVRAPRRPLCLLSELDFITDRNGLAIAPTVGKSPSDTARFESQLRLCQACGFRDPCLELSKGNEYGIWGGMLPYDRRRYWRQRKKGTR